MTKYAEARERVKARLLAAIDGGAVPEARLRIDQLNFGPPVGFPVQFRVTGPDPLKVREIADQVRDGDERATPTPSTCSSTGTSRPRRVA